LGVRFVGVGLTPKRPYVRMVDKPVLGSVT
jgi:hypothetical protein